MDGDKCLLHSTTLIIQNQPLKDSIVKPHAYGHLWFCLFQKGSSSLPLTQSLADTLPQNANLHCAWGKLPMARCNLCGQWQSRDLLHVLKLFNVCPFALEKRWYNCWHAWHSPRRNTFCGSTSLPIWTFLLTFPQEIAVTGTQPDIIVWEPSTITLMELTASTINFELHQNCYSEEETQILKSTE